MAGSGPANAIARRAIDEISEFSGETETPKYMKVFISQEIVETRRFIRVNRIREDKLRGLNETIAAAEDEISTLESHLEIMDAAINSDD
ncbi:hypothetical protein Tco_1394049 [Tanacetum coccineum]